MNKSIDIVTERPWFSIGLMKVLMSKGYFNRLYTGFPKKTFVSAGIPEEQVTSWPLAAVWNYAMNRLGLKFLPKRNEPLALASHVSGTADLAPVVSCFGTSYMHLFPKIADRPVIRVVECGAMHPEDHYFFQQRGRKEAEFPYGTTLPPWVAEEVEAAKMAHLLICGSKMVADSYLRRGYDPSRVLHCPYGVDTKRFRYMERMPPTGRPIRMVTVGMICIRKGILRLVRIMEWAHKTGIELELHLIGPMDPEAKKILAQSGIKYISHGVLKSGELIAKLHECDIFCLPSYEEGFPVAQVEAMATGLPSITSNDTGGREAVTDGVNGLILCDFTEDEFNTKLKPWLQHSENLPAAGAAAAEIVRHLYSMPAYADHVSRCYEFAMKLATQLQSGNSVSTSFPHSQS